MASRRRWWQSRARAWCRGRHRDQRRRWSRWSFGDAADRANSRCNSLQVRAMSPVGAGCSWCSSARMTARKAWARIARVTQRSQGVWRRTWCSSRPARPLPAWKVSSIFQRVPARRTGAAPRRSRSPSSRRRSRRRRGRPARRRGDRRRTRADHRGPRPRPTWPAPTDAASRPEWPHRPTPQSSSSSCGADRPAVGNEPPHPPPGFRTGETPGYARHQPLELLVPTGKAHAVTYGRFLIFCLHTR